MNYLVVTGGPDVANLVALRVAVSGWCQEVDSLFLVRAVLPCLKPWCRLLIPRYHVP